MTNQAEQLALPRPPRKAARTRSGTPAHGRYRTALRTPRARAGLALISTLVLVAVIVPYFLPHGPTAQSGLTLSPPSRGYLLGTDELGRDIFSRLLNGIRTDLGDALNAAVLRK